MMSLTQLIAKCICYRFSKHLVLTLGLFGVSFLCKGILQEASVATECWRSTILLQQLHFQVFWKFSEAPVISALKKVTCIVFSQLL